MCAVPNMAVFCSSLILCFPQTLNRYFLNDSEMAPVTRYYRYHFTFHMYCISFARSSNFRIFIIIIITCIIYYLFKDTWFPSSRKTNSNNYTYCCSEKPHTVHKVSLHDIKVWGLDAMCAHKIMGPRVFKN
jgi:hypothetical protein